MLDKVTITGADDSIVPEDLVPLSERYPFVEWGILLSRTQEGSPRFPSLHWLERLADVTRGDPRVRLSGHLCGRWVRDLCAGHTDFLVERKEIAFIFDRVQLNFHASKHEILNTFFAALHLWRRREYILQAARPEALRPGDLKRNDWPDVRVRAHDGPGAPEIT